MYLTGTQVCWVQVRRLGGRLDRLQYAAEDVCNGDLRGALQRLVARIAPRDPYVVANLDALHVRAVVIQGPPFDDEEAQAAWVQGQAGRQLPPGTRLEDFVVRFRPTIATDERTVGLMLLARREAVEARAALVQEVGLVPVGIGCADTAVGDMLAFDAPFLEGRSAVLVVRAMEAVLLGYREGLLDSVVTLGWGRDHAAALVEEVRVQLAGWAAGSEAGAPARLYVVGVAGEGVAEQARAARIAGGTVLEVGTFKGYRNRDLPLPPSHLPAAALAVSHLFPGLQPLSLMEGVKQQAWQSEVEKQAATRSVLGMGAVLAACLLLLVLLATWLDLRQSRTSEALLQLADRITEVEQARAALQQLEADVAQAERLVTERTNVAGLMAWIGRATPETLWFDALHLTTPPSGAARLTLYGAAFDEAPVAALLDSLEQAAFLENVRLVYAEQVPAQALYKQATVPQRTLARFEISLEVPSLTLTYNTER